MSGLIPLIKRCFPITEIAKSKFEAGESETDSLNYFRLDEKFGLRIELEMGRRQVSYMFHQFSKTITAMI